MGGHETMFVTYDVISKRVYKAYAGSLLEILP